MEDFNTKTPKLFTFESRVQSLVNHIKRVGFIRANRIDWPLSLVVNSALKAGLIKRDYEEKLLVYNGKITKYKHYTGDVIKLA
jgi:hypothetical protein